MQKSESKFIRFIKSFSFYKNTFISFILLFLFLNIVNNLYSIVEIFRLDLGLSTFLNLFIDFSSFVDTKSIFLYFFMIFILSINMSLFLYYIKIQNSLYTHKDNNPKTLVFQNIKNFFFVFIGMLFSHCASCGIVLFGGFLSLGTTLFFVNYGIYLQIFVIIMIIINIYYLIKKINNPFVC